MKRFTLLGSMAVAACSGQFDFDVDPPDAGAVVDAGGGVDAEVVVDAPSMPQDLGSSDAGPGRVICASSSCTLPEHGCCITTRSFCIDVDDVACRGLLVHCDGTSDCALGQSCCATVADAGVTSFECKDTCNAPEYVTLCDPTDPNECGTCRAASAPLPQEYFQCY